MSQLLEKSGGEISGYERLAGGAGRLKALRTAGWSCRSVHMGRLTAPRLRGLKEFRGRWEEAALTLG